MTSVGQWWWFQGEDPAEEEEEEEEVSHEKVCECQVPLLLHIMHKTLQTQLTLHTSVQQRSDAHNAQTLYWTHSQSTRCPKHSNSFCRTLKNTLYTIHAIFCTKHKKNWYLSHSSRHTTLICLVHFQFLQQFEKFYATSGCDKYQHSNKQKGRFTKHTAAVLSWFTLFWRKINFVAI